MEVVKGNENIFHIPSDVLKGTSERNRRKLFLVAVVFSYLCVIYYVH